MHQLFTSDSDPEPSKRTARLLVVSRQPSALRELWSTAVAACWEFEVAGSGCEALECVHAASHDVVLLDLAPGDPDGIYTLRWLRRVRPDLPVLVLAEQDAEQQREAMRLGALEYLAKPVESVRLRALVEGCVPRQDDATHSSKEQAAISVASNPGNGQGPGTESSFFLSASPVSGKLRAQAEVLAQVDVPVLILGESGSGKESTARLIHSLSARAANGFYHVHCAALDEELLERDLLGYEAGAFPGALRSKPGKLEQAEKGTILLDDIGESPLHLQAKLMHLLQEREFFRLGGESPRGANVRLMAATSANPEQVLAGKRLREDLYYRLSAFTVHVPPLRQRRSEIPQLLEHFMRQLARHYGLPPRRFSPPLLAACQGYPWPGNLRELEGMVKRYLVMGDEELILGELRRGRDIGGNPMDGEEQGWGRSRFEAGFPPGGATRPGGGTRAPARARNDGGHAPEAGGTREAPEGLRSLLVSVKGEAERNAIGAALERTRWNRKAAARLLGVSYRTLLYKIQQYQMVPPEVFALSSSAGETGQPGSGQEIAGNDGD